MGRPQGSETILISVFLHYGGVLVRAGLSWGTFPAWFFAELWDCENRNILGKSDPPVSDGPR